MRVRSSRCCTARPMTSSRSGSATPSMCAAIRSVFARNRAQASRSAPAAAITVRDANEPVLSGEAAVSPACTVTAS